MTRFAFLVASTVLVASTAIGACSHFADDCENTSTCPPEGGSNSAGSATGGKGGSSGSGSSGKSNAGDGGAGTAGSAMGGSTTGGKGGSSATAGEAGASGGGAMLPCDGACASPKPVCDEPTDTCVECLEEGDCAAGAKKKCDTTAKTCVECLAPADCTDATTAKCDSGACVKCTSNDDCAHIAGKTVCDTAAGECVQCTGKDYASCGMDMGTPLVCDTGARTCTTKKKGSSGLCQTCVSDAQCSAGKLCVEEKFGNQAQSVGFFCFYKQGDTANGAPADCFADGAPYAKTLVNQTSIDGTSGDICGLRSSTCVARNQFSSKDCSTANAADDSKCGFAPGQDSQCDQVGASANFRCTTTCLSDDDCDPGVTCNTGAAPKFCEL